MKGQTDFDLIADAGFYVCVRMQFASPLFSQYRMPPAWLESYTAQGMILADPLMLWAHQNVGITRWTEVAFPDPRQILGHAKKFGMEFGAVAACFDPHTSERSLGIFATRSREFSETELAQLMAGLTSLHDTRMRPFELTAHEKEVLRRTRDGEMPIKIAASLHLNDAMITDILDRTRQKLGARSIDHAVAIAEDAELL